MDKKVVENRNYKYLILSIFQIIIFFGIVSYVFEQHTELENESSQFYIEMSQKSPNNNYWLGQYAEIQGKEYTLEWNFLITLVVINIFHILISILFIRKSKNDIEKFSLGLWIAVSVILLIYAGNGNLINDLFHSEIITQLIFVFLSIPLIIKTIFGTFIGERILESDFKIKKSINSHNSKTAELKDLLDSGIITKEEFKEKSENLNKGIISDRIENDKEFIEIKSKLNKAVKSGLIEKEVAETKITEFRERLLQKFNKTE